jgi:predicted small secreted protein
MKKILFTISSLILGCSLLAACHTVQGAGKDIQDTGHTITRAAS